MPIIPEDTPTEAILTEDGQLVRVGDRVYCYYDRLWGTIRRIEDTHQSADPDADPRNQVLWADIVGDDARMYYFNGQRLATRNPDGEQR